MSATGRLASRLLVVAAGPFTLALELERLSGLLPASARLEPVPCAPWVLGRVRHQREDIPWVSLCTKLGFGRAGPPKRGFIHDFGGFQVAFEFDEVVGIVAGEDVEYRPLPPGISELPAENLPGLVLLKGGAALLLRIDGLFREDELVQIGEALFS